LSRERPRHGDHQQEVRSLSQNRLWWALTINVVFLAVEAVGGLLANSLALLADAGHMLTDVAALALALFVSHLAARPSTPTRTFGLLRAEVLGALLNGIVLILVVGVIFWEAWHRFGRTEVVNGPLMLGIAAGGLFANFGSAWILAGTRKANINVQAAFLHMLADILGSLGAIAAGLVIWITGWYPIDPLMSVIIGALILWSTWSLLKQSVNILLEATPEGVNFVEVKKALEDMELIHEVHDLHIWTITSGMPILSAHIILSSDSCREDQWQACLTSTQEMLKKQFGITHATLQVEHSKAKCGLESCSGNRLDR